MCVSSLSHVKSFFRNEQMSMEMFTGAMPFLFKELFFLQLTASGMCATSRSNTYSCEHSREQHMISTILFNSILYQAIFMWTSPTFDVAWNLHSLSVYKFQRLPFLMNSRPELSKNYDFLYFSYCL